MRASRARLCASNCKPEDGYWRRMLVGDSCYFVRVECQVTDASAKAGLLSKQDLGVPVGGKICVCAWTVGCARYADGL